MVHQHIHTHTHAHTQWIRWLILVITDDKHDWVDVDEDDEIPYDVVSWIAHSNITHVVWLNWNHLNWCSQMADSSVYPGTTWSCRGSNYALNLWISDAREGRSPSALYHPWVQLFKFFELASTFTVDEQIMLKLEKCFRFNKR